jgi:hypothetical protein
MRDSKKRERAGIEAVARRFSARWESHGGSQDACIVVAGKRVALDIRAFTRRGGQGCAARPRLRFDKVATRLIGRLRATLGGIAPEGTTVLLTITAPIRLPSKTAASLEHRIRTRLGRRTAGREDTATIHGNRVRIRMVRDESGRAPTMIGFVHHADSDPRPLLNMTRGLLEILSAEAGRAPSRAGDRWLVVTSAGDSSCLKLYREIYSQLRMTTAFKKILMTFDDGRVGILTG